MLLVIHNQPGDDRPRRVFLSYSHQDDAWRRRVVEALESLEKQQRIAAWDDHEILPGENWDKKIRQELDLADVILFLVSPAFIQSDYCRGVEVKRAVTRSDAGEAVLVPIIVHRCEFQKQPFAPFQAYPVDGFPLAEATDHEARLADLREKLGLALLGWWYPRRPRGNGASPATLARFSPCPRAGSRSTSRLMSRTPSWGRLSPAPNSAAT